MDESLTLRATNQIFKFDASLDCYSEDDCQFTLDFESGTYRQKDLVGLIRDTLPFFALTQDEISSLDQSSWYRHSVTRISEAAKNSKGDYGELLLFIILHVFYKSPKFVTKARLRSSTREQIKGFDCAHFTIDPAGVTTLWLGEAKFHQEFSGAVGSAFESLTEHFSDPQRIKSELKLLGGEIEINKTLEKEKFISLKRELISAKSLDKVKIKIPVLITYDSKCVSEVSGQPQADILSEEFQTRLSSELKKKFQSIKGREWPIKGNVAVAFYVLPLACVAELKADLALVEQALRF